MCLTIDQDVTAEVAKQLKEHGFIWAYKYFRRTSSSKTVFNDWNKMVRVSRGLRSAYQHHFKWNRGLNASSRESTALVEDLEDSRIYDGFHVFLDIKGLAHMYGQDYLTAHKTIVRVKCHERHFVSAGHVYNWRDLNIRNAVFTKIELPRDEYRKAVMPQSLAWKRAKKRSNRK